jgi:hypothetical protein
MANPAPKSFKPSDAGILEIAAFGADDKVEGFVQYKVDWIGGRTTGLAPV